MYVRGGKNERDDEDIEVRATRIRKAKQTYDVYLVYELRTPITPY